MIFLPPQHGKSELVSRRFPAFVPGRIPDLRPIGSSQTNNLVIGMNRNVQRTMASPACRNIFPAWLADRRPRSPEARRRLDFFGIAGRRGSLRSAGVGKDRPLDVEAILAHIVLDHLVRKAVLHRGLGLLLYCSRAKTIVTQSVSEGGK